MILETCQAALYVSTDLPIVGRDIEFLVPN